MKAASPMELPSSPAGSPPAFAIAEYSPTNTTESVGGCTESVGEGAGLVGLAERASGAR